MESALGAELARAIKLWIGKLKEVSFFMWIVRIALDRPYTYIVLAILILPLSPVMILRTPTDIFPHINIPVVAVAWQYNGMSSPKSARRSIDGFFSKEILR